MTRDTSIVLDAEDLVEDEPTEESARKPNSISGTMSRVVTETIITEPIAASDLRPALARRASQRFTERAPEARITDQARLVSAEMLLSIRTALWQLRGLPEPHPIDATALLEPAELQRWCNDVSAQIDGLRKDRETVNKRSAEQQTTIRKLEAERTELAAALSKAETALRTAVETNDRALADQREQSSRLLAGLQTLHDATLRDFQVARNDADHALEAAAANERARVAIEQEFERTEIARQQEVTRAKLALEEANLARAEAEKARKATATSADELRALRVQRLELQQALTDTKARLDAVSTALEDVRATRAEAATRVESERESPDLQQHLAAQAKQLADEYAAAKRESDAKWMVELQGRVLAAIELLETDRAEALTTQLRAHETELARAGATWAAHRADLEAEIRTLALDVAKANDALDEAAERIQSLEATVDERTVANDRAVLANNALSTELANERDKATERETVFARRTREFDETVERIQAALGAWKRRDV